jgi:Uma2 family endonuclease
MQVLDRRGEVSFSPLLRRYTLEEFWSLPEPGDRYRFELIEGALIMVPPAVYPHDDLDARLNKFLLLFLFHEGLEGDVHHPQAAIYRNVEAGTYLEPDMMYVSPELKERMGKKRSSADIVFEYSSKSTVNYDRTTKADTYLALGVRELWLIDSETVSIEVRYARKQESHPYWLIHRYEAGEFAESEVLKGWRVSVDELFEGLI